MTRFARAKGSKASNEKLPHQSTSWSAMKEDLQKSQEQFKNKHKREEFIQERQKNYNNFLQQSAKPQQKNWAEFPQPNLKTIKKNKKKKSLINVTENDVTDEMINELCYSDPEVDTQLKSLTEQVDSTLKKTEKLKVKALNDVPKPKKLKEEEPEDDEAPEESSTTVQPKKIQIKKAKAKKQALKIAPVKSEDNVAENPQQKQKVVKQRRKQIKQETVIVNGKTEAVVYSQRFPMLESDKKRLDALRHSLMRKKMPSDEIFHIMKLERRKAERTLARIKRKICFNCRTGGHMSVDCPSLKSTIVQNAPGGFCYNCGSTEHFVKDCKGERQFKFATCFVCKKQGHISNQCPDNPKGIYPNGGACRRCGDVTHLAKDCSKTSEIKQENDVSVSTIAEDNIEGVDDDPKPKKPKVLKKKIVKY